ncbi:hypothetical protein Tco_1438309 [Tanacetum coccineum]
MKRRPVSAFATFKESSRNSIQKDDNCCHKDSNLRRKARLILHTLIQEDSSTRIKTRKNLIVANDELHKSADGTLYDVQDCLLNDASNYKAVRLRFSDPMIQPEPEGSTQGYPLDSVEVLRFNTSAGNPVKKILLKLNLSDHRLCKMVVECQSVKVKEFQERCNIKAFQEWYEHVGPEVASPQGGKVTRWRRDYAWLMISRCSRSLCQIQVQGTSSNQEVNDHYNIFTRESQEYELKTKDKA